jgi:hypothetical protein
MPPPSYKLPGGVVPSHYAIVQAPNFSTFMCKGEVTIDIDVQEPTSSITLHARDLIIDAAYVVHENGTRLDSILVPATVKLIDPDTGKAHDHSFTSAASLDLENERARFDFNGILGKGAWKLVAFYSASMFSQVWRVSIAASGKTMLVSTIGWLPRNWRQRRRAGLSRASMSRH